MRRRLISLAGICFSMAFIVIVVGKYVIVAQTVVNGEWNADSRPQKAAKDKDTDKDYDAAWQQKDTEGKLHLEFHEDRGNNHKNQFGSYLAYEELQGLTRGQAQNGRVSFRIVR